eukprot:TRINITY_DN304_c1_g1_i3.p1 TRINITY_DN304_c1_g1~~TRINITY_DN304_c1_g1_i3.p1  ORF type:complete len:2218 (+),score=619.13 TRINITY_DN304_c1_g1_i3:143-6655(+)
MSGPTGTSGTLNTASQGNSGTSGTSGGPSAGSSGAFGGTPGTTSMSGPSGTSGTTGMSGPPGSSGAFTTTGLQGTSGMSGPNGSSGAVSTASQGNSGTSGTSGGPSAGSSGDLGGTSGTSGMSGPSGSSGAFAATGSHGMSGPTDTSGAVSTASQGNFGTSGTSSGPSAGSSGDLGGTSGTSGMSGPSGSSGAFAATGSHGMSGPTDTSGAVSTASQGNFGTSGTSSGPSAGSSGVFGGTSGTSGMSGTTGTGAVNTAAQGNSGSSGTSGGPSAGSSGAFDITGSQGTSGSSSTAVGSGTSNGSTGGSSAATGGLSSGSGSTAAVDNTGSSNTGTGGFAATGAVSSTGSQGTSDMSGDVGVTGLQGTSGISGSVSSSGASGISGASATSGTSGQLISSGNVGLATSHPSDVSGPTGTSGALSTSGMSVSVSSSGTVGIDDTSGMSGTSGASGLSALSSNGGVTGSQATSGMSVPSSSSGAAGITESPGTSGTSGTSGIGAPFSSSGKVSVTGTVGTFGMSGPSGSSGTSGTSGMSGPSGSSGTSGTAGMSGPSGSSATVDITGSQGIAGTSGMPGTSSSSGNVGTTGSPETSGTPGTSSMSGPFDSSGPSAGSSGAFGTGSQGSSGMSGPSSGFATTGSSSATVGSGSSDVSTGVSSAAATGSTVSGPASSSGAVAITGSQSITSGGSAESTSPGIGITGSQGTSGSSGTATTTGTHGMSGASGSSGNIGVTGSPGSSATTGMSGPSSSSGTVDITGSQGTSGTSDISTTTLNTSGLSGSSASSGMVGVTGSQGTSDSSGTDDSSSAVGSSGSTGTGRSPHITGSVGITNTISAVPPQPPPVSTNVTGPTSTRVWWTLSMTKRAASGNDVSAVTLEMSNDTVDFFEIHHVQATSFDVPVTGLRPSTDYWFRVYTSNAYGNSPYSDAVQVRTDSIREHVQTGSPNQDGEEVASPKTHDPGLNWAWIVGIAAGVLLCCIAIAVALLVFRRRRQRRVAPDPSVSSTPASATPPFESSVNVAISEESSDTSSETGPFEGRVYDGLVVRHSGSSPIAQAGTFKFNFVGHAVVFHLPIEPRSIKHPITALRVNADDSIRLTTDTGFVDFTTPGGARLVQELSERCVYDGHVVRHSGFSPIAQAGDFKFTFVGHQVVFFKPMEAKPILGEYMMTALRVNADDSIRLTTDTGFVDFTTPGGARLVPELSGEVAMAFPGDASATGLVAGTELTDKQLFDSLTAMPSDLRTDVLRTLALQSGFAESATGRHYLQSMPADDGRPLISTSAALMYLRHYLNLPDMHQRRTVLPRIQQGGSVAQQGPEVTDEATLADLDEASKEVTSEATLADLGQGSKATTSQANRGRHQRHLVVGAATLADLDLDEQFVNLAPAEIAELSLSSQLTETQCDLAIETLEPTDRARVRRSLRDPLPHGGTSTGSRDEFDAYGFLDDSDDEGVAVTSRRPLGFRDAKQKLIDGFRTFAKLPDIQKRQIQDAVRARRRRRALRVSASDLSADHKRLALEVLPEPENRAVKKAYRTHHVDGQSSAQFWVANDPVEEALVSRAPGSIPKSMPPTEARPVVPLISLPAADRLLLKGWKTFQKLPAISKAWVKSSVQDRVSDTKEDLTVKDLSELQKTCALVTVPEPTRSNVSSCLSVPLQLEPNKVLRSFASEAKLNTDELAESKDVAKAGGSVEKKSSARASGGHKVARFQAEAMVVSAFRTFAKLPFIKKKDVHEAVLAGPGELDARFSAKVKPEDDVDAEARKSRFRDDWQKDLDAFGTQSRSEDAVSDFQPASSPPSTPRQTPAQKEPESSPAIADKGEDVSNVARRLASGLGAAGGPSDNKFLDDRRQNGAFESRPRTSSHQPITTDTDEPVGKPFSRSYSWKWDVDLTVRKRYSIAGSDGATVEMSPDIAARVIQGAFRDHRLKLLNKRLLAIVRIQRWWRSKHTSIRERLRKLQRVTKLNSKSSSGKRHPKEASGGRAPHRDAKGRREHGKPATSSSSEVSLRRAPKPVKPPRHGVNEASAEQDENWLKRSSQVASLRNDRIRSELEEIDIMQQNMASTAATLIQRLFRNRRRLRDLAKHKASNARLRARRLLGHAKDDTLESELDAVLDAAYGFKASPTSGLADTLRITSKHRAAKLSYVEQLRAIEIGESAADASQLDEAEEFCRRILY